MAFTLSKASKCKVKYSERERVIFGLLPKDGSTINTWLLVEKYYQTTNDIQPYYSLKAMIGVMRGLVDKVDHNNEPFIIQRSARQGPYPIDYWIEPFKRKPLNND